MVGADGLFITIDVSYFPYTQGSGRYGYWSSTTLIENSNWAWVVGFDYGYVDYSWYTGRKSDRCYARAVRSVELPPEYVSMDIKPGSCPNPINTNSKGILAVAILGTEDLDVRDVDVASITLEGINPIRCRYEDVATPFEPFIGKEDCDLDCTEAGPDGWQDLTLKFDTQEIVDGLVNVEDGECRVLKLKGYVLGGMHIEGEDVVIIKKKEKNNLIFL